jgi:hypothetical protein
MHIVLDNMNSDEYFNYKRHSIDKWTDIRFKDYIIVFKLT